MLTAQTLAMRLQGREHRSEMTEAEEAEAKARGLVVVFGASDDLMEFRGAIRDEVGAYEGTTVALTDKGLCKNECEAEDCPAHVAAVHAARKIEAKWCPDIGITWAYATDIPHFIFEVMEDDEVYCQGIVFALADAAPETGEPPQWIDDPHDIEQGRMLNPAWLKAHGLTAAKAAERLDQFAGADKMVGAAQAERKSPTEAQSAMASYKLSIVADSGYEATTEGRCNAEQYGNAIAALHGITATSGEEGGA